MAKGKGPVTMGLVFCCALLLLGVAGCVAQGWEAAPATGEQVMEAPAEVVAAREELLRFLRQDANDCVPPAGITWRLEEGSAPDGYRAYRFLAQDCVITVSYDEAEEQPFYHVALGDGSSGFCWQAVVDNRNKIVRTGAAAQSEPGRGNPAADFCEARGHTYEVREDRGPRCGFCVFADGSSCNAWAYFHGTCGATTGD